MHDTCDRRARLGEQVIACGGSPMAAGRRPGLPGRRRTARATLLGKRHVDAAPTRRNWLCTFPGAGELTCRDGEPMAASRPPGRPASDMTRSTRT
ncbi:hypothetical protein ACU686_28055 [Yinghuangia aomiensis]